MKNTPYRGEQPRAKKSLGQHFLHDTRVLQRIADAAELQPDSAVLEIGPGTGALTRCLAARAGRLAAVEIDPRMITILQREFADKPHVRIVHADAAAMDWQALQREQFDGKPFTLCANLPYYITSPLIMAALEGGADVQTIVVLIQREVAQRLAARPGQSEYGLLSLAVQRYASVEMLFTVPPGCFSPPPKVYSAVVRLKRRPDAPSVEASQGFFMVARAAFAMRRKTLANNLMQGLQLSRQEVEEGLQRIGLSPSVRAETLPGEAFDAIAAELLPAQEKTPG